MGAVIGMTIGYVMGARAGAKGLEELQGAWKTISSSDEVKEMIIGGLALARDMIHQGRHLLAERLQEPEAGLRSVA